MLTVIYNISLLVLNITIEKDNHKAVKDDQIFKFGCPLEPNFQVEFC